MLSLSPGWLVGPGDLRRAGHACGHGEVPPAPGSTTPGRGATEPRPTAPRAGRLTVIPEAVWEAVQAALDERRDPLDEDAVREHLLSHPEDLATLDRLADRLAAVARRELVPEASAGTPAAAPATSAAGPGTPTAAPGTPAAAPATLATGQSSIGIGRRWVAVWAGHPRRSAAAAAAVLLVALVFGWLPEQTSQLPTASSSPEAVAGSPAVARVLSWKITVSKTDSSGTTREVSQPSGFLMTHRAARPSTRQPVRTLAFAWTDSWTRP